MHFIVILVIVLTLQQNTFALEVHGHRGARTVLPENSLAAFEYAYDIGVDVLELDLTFTKDNQVVVYHDTHTNLERCVSTDNSLNQKSILIRELTLSQIKSFDCGSKFHPQFPVQKKIPGTPIPTLSEVFELILKKQKNNYRPVRFNIETKTQESQGLLPDSEVIRFVDLTLQVIDKYNQAGNVVIQSFDDRSLMQIKKLRRNEIALSGLNYDKFKNSLNWAKRLKLDIISPYFQFVTPKYVKKAHDMGLKVIPWTVNSSKDWAKLIAYDVDGIITDDPNSLIEYLKQKGLRK